ncbi:MAG: hypothetical protein R3F15_08415 [Lysobacterales bacterium]
MLWFGSAMSIWLAIPLAIGVAMGSAMLVAAGGLAAGQLLAVRPGESLGAAYVSVLVSVSGLMLLLILITLLPEPFR